MKTKIGVIFGGRSGEHEISIRSAKTVIEQINKQKYEVIPIAINPKGKWLSPTESLNLLPVNTRSLLDDREMSSDEIALLGDTDYRGLTKINSADTEKNMPLDVVFPVLHGTFGEDGTLQGLLEMAGVPYVGCGVLASACGMDKAIMKTLFRDAELPLCKYVWFLRDEWEKKPQKVLDSTVEKLGFPCFIKPANLGSSVGVSKANDRDSLRQAIDLAAEYDRKIIVEEGLEMREIECAVIGNDEPQASLPGEYVIKDDDKAFLDYTEKYSGTGNNEFIVPAPVSDELTKIIQEMAIRAFKAIDGSGLARVDFFLRRDNGAIILNEINTLPGLTDASGFPKMWEGSGKSFTEVLDILIDLAHKRFADRTRNKTTF